MAKSNKEIFFPALDSFVDKRVAAFDGIPAERKVQLKKIAHYVQSGIEMNRETRLTFICTHNSRRSHMAQIWAQTAAVHYGVANVATYSGGTGATAFDRRAVAALQRAGFSMIKSTSGENPVYRVRYNDSGPALEAFSKVYDETPNPSENYCAVMTCSQADADCPVVQGASMRVAIPYDDPKEFDGTEEEAAKYDERCRQISVEMLYLFSLVEPK